MEAEQCECGLQTEVHGETRLARKPTAFATNIWYVAEELDRKCSGKHAHFSLMEGRAAKAQEYQPELCEAVCGELQTQMDFNRTGLCSTINTTTSDMEAAIQR